MTNQGALPVTARISRSFQTPRNLPLSISSNGPQSIAAFPRENTRIGGTGLPCHGEPPGFTPRAISHNRQNRKFSACRALKKAAENQFYQEIATANTENGNCPADGVGLLGRIAACLV